jgi:hypothetical protein
MAIGTHQKGIGMEASRFDRLSKTVSHAGTRRGALRLLAALPLVGRLAALLDDAASDAAQRRTRHKKVHHGRLSAAKKHKKKKHKKCKLQPLSTTCAGKCGTVTNNCKRPVDCGACACAPPCGACETCSDALTCDPCDPCCDDVCCPQANAVCHASTNACCIPDTKAQTCNGQCGDVVNNCGLSVNCGACTCTPSCPACQVCDETDGQCVADPSQQGDSCGDGQVCQADGTCACDATSCGACRTCGGDGQCHACANNEVCCDSQCVIGVCCEADDCLNTGEVCAGHVCQCPGGTKLCGQTCIPATSCCEDSECATNEKCCGGVCTNVTTVQECGACGHVCPGYQKPNTNVTCNQGTCTFSCQGSAYDLDGDPSTGCESLDDTPAAGTKDAARDLHSFSCSDTPLQFTGIIVSDARVHEQPTLSGFDASVGASPDWWRVHADGGITCSNDIAATITTSGGGATLCYKLSIMTDKVPLTTAVVNGHGSASLTINSSAYSDDTDIYFKIEKTCSTSIRERVSYTVDYHL